MENAQNKSPPHTTGPWRADTDNHQYGNYCVLAGDATTIAITVAGLSLREEATNAQLIVAAPDLLEAPIKIERHLPGVVKLLEIEAFEGKSIENAKAALNNARAAIAKAKGGEV